MASFLGRPSPKGTGQLSASLGFCVLRNSKGKVIPEISSCEPLIVPTSTSYCGQVSGILSGARPRVHAHSGAWGHTSPYPRHKNPRVREGPLPKAIPLLLLGKGGLDTRQSETITIHYHLPMCSLGSFTSTCHLGSPPSGLSVGTISIKSFYLAPNWI